MASRKEQKTKLREERLARERAEESKAKTRHTRNIIISVFVIAAALVGLVFLVPENKGSGPGAKQAATMIGKAAPAFTVRDVVSGRDLTLTALRGHKTLLFFSEGASCQACMVQAVDLQKDPLLRRAKIDLVSITVDSADTLSEVAEQYGITTPLLADESTKMSADYGMLGRGGMGHPGIDGHAFMLLSAEGKVLWEKAYQPMYVPVKELLRNMKQPAV